MRVVLTCGEVIHHLLRGVAEGRSPANVFLMCSLCVLNRHVVELQKKDHLLLAYAKKGYAGGVLIALQAGANVNHRYSV